MMDSERPRKCPRCGKRPKVTFPDVDGGCTLAHPKADCPHSGMLELFATPQDAVRAWNAGKVDEVWGRFK